MLVLGAFKNSEANTTTNRWAMGRASETTDEAEDLDSWHQGLRFLMGDESEMASPAKERMRKRGSSGGKGGI